MNQLNSLIVEGNLTQDPIMKEPAEGFKVCSLSLAVNRWYKNKKGNGSEEVSYFDVETYGRMAEVCQQKLKRGSGVRVVGRLKQDRWEDSNGKAKSKVYVIAEHVEFKPVFTSSEKTDSKNESVSEKTAGESTASETSSETVTEYETEKVPEPETVPVTEEAVF